MKTILGMIYYIANLFIFNRCIGIKSRLFISLNENEEILYYKTAWGWLSYILWLIIYLAHSFIINITRDN